MRPNPKNFVFLALSAAILAFSAAGVAAPPPGHPSPAQASDILLPHKAPRPAELPNEGKVVSFTHANEFTYIEVTRKKTGITEWIAAPKMDLKAGAAIRYDEGAIMKDFYSKLLKKTFPSVMFVDYVSVVGSK